MSLPEPQAGLGRSRAAALLLLFLLSGASSLVYQILWVRSLSLTLGSTVFAISIVVSAFMSGLALGSALVGARAGRWRSPLRLYALLELGIGGSAFLMPLAFAAIARAALSSAEGRGLAALPWFPFVTSFAALLVPTTLMGGTLPVLSRFVAGFPGSRGALIGALYAANTIGAIAGAALAGFVLIRALGIRGATFVAASANLLIVVASFSLASQWRLPAVAESPGEAGEESEDGGLIALVTFVYFVTGLSGLALEVLWTRAILLFTINTIYAFTVILTTFLAGLALGSSLMSALLARLRHAAALLGGLQCLLALITALTPLGLSAVGVPLFTELRELAAPLGRAGQLGSAYVVAAVFMLPATFLMGASFPLVVRIVAGRTARVGLVVGRIYAVNTIGAVLGSLLAGFLLLPWLGIQRSILLVALLSSGAGLLLVLRVRSRSFGALGVASGAAGLVLLLASPNHFRAMLEESLDVEFTFYEEGIESTVGVYDSELAGRPVLVINNTRLHDRGVVHKLLAHLPALLHPDPKRALVLGFGVGMTSEAFAAHGIEVNDCVEISPAVMHAAPSFREINGDIAGRGDPSFRVFVTDARKLLVAGRDPYDIIALDANSGVLRNAGVGKLYSREFFELCRKRLTPGGIVTLYASPNGSMQEFTMVLRTFTEVFPHATLWVDKVFGETTVLLGTDRPVRIHLGRWLERIRKPRVSRDLAVFGLEQPAALLSMFAMGEEMLRYFCRRGELNTDDHPIMEFHPLLADRFAANDKPFDDLGFQFHRDRVLPILEAAEGLPEAPAVLDYLARAGRSFFAICEAWQHRSRGDRSKERDFMAVAAKLHPEAEFLRSALGYGRLDYRRAVQALARSPSAAQLASAGWMALERGANEDALRFFEEALRAAGEAGRLPAGRYHAGGARAQRALGHLAAAQRHLQEAGRLGLDVSYDRAELELAAVPEGAGLPLALIQRAAKGALGRDAGRAVELLMVLDGEGALDAELAETTALCLETLGDMAGAYHYYRLSLEKEPGRETARAGLAITGLELALRYSLHQRVHPGRAQAVLESPFSGKRVAASEVPPRDQERAAPWLELADLYLRTGNASMALRRARAARYLEPDNAAAYVAIARAASEPSVKRLALERALELDPGNARARAGLKSLDER